MFNQKFFIENRSYNPLTNLTDSHHITAKLTNFLKVTSPHNISARSSSYCKFFPALVRRAGEDKRGSGRVRLMVRAQLAAPPGTDEAFKHESSQIARMTPADHERVCFTKWTVML